VTRVIVLDGPRSPAANMALDEAALHAASRRGIATVRVYTWSPPGLSLGRSQPIGEVRVEVLPRLGVLPVRRPTGGRAILHLPGDLTYSIAAPAESPLHRASVEEAAFLAASAVARALSRLGVPARPGGLVSYKPAGPLCLAARWSGDVLVGDYKVSGAAVARTRGATLVHGVILVRGDRSLWREIVPDRFSRSLERYERWVRGLEALGYSLPPAGFAEALRAEVEPLLGGPVERGMLAWGLVEEADRLAREKYSSGSWTLWARA